MGNQEDFSRFLGSLWLLESFWLLSRKSQKNEKQPGRARRLVELLAGALQRDAEGG